jgi:hypothetical protein
MVEDVKKNKNVKNFKNFKKVVKVKNKIIMVDVSQNIGTYLGYISTELLTKIYTIIHYQLTELLQNIESLHISLTTNQ